MVAAALTVLMVVGLAGHSVLSGPVLFSISATHGVHRDDLGVVAAWLIGLYGAWRLARR